MMHRKGLVPRLAEWGPSNASSCLFNADSWAQPHTPEHWGLELSNLHLQVLQLDPVQSKGEKVMLLIRSQHVFSLKV